MSDVPPLDRRVRRTRAALREALLRLVVTTDYDGLTIQAIADAADTSRVTFYRHYRDKEELLLDCLEQVYQDLTRRMARIRHDDLQLETPPIRVLYDFAHANRAVLKALMTGKAGLLVQRRIRDYLIKLIQRDIERAFPRRRSGAPLTLVAVHVAAAEVGTLMWWLETGSTHPPAEMAALSHRLSLVGALQGAGVNARGLGAGGRRKAGDGRRRP